MGVIKLELHCPQNVNGMAADPQPDWSFDDLRSELDTMEKKLIPSLDIYVHFDKKRPRNLRASKENRCNTGGFAMHVSDHELGCSDSDVEEEVVNSSMVSGRKFSFEELYMSDGSDYELPVYAQCQLMDKVGLAEGALHELSYEFQLYVSEEVRNKISTLETNLVKENEKFASQIAEIDKHRRTQQERERKFDLQYHRTIAEALDNHLTAVQRDHEHISQLEEKRIRDDAAREEAKRKEKTLIEEKLQKEKIKAEEEARLHAERAEIAKAAAEAEKQSVEGKRHAEKQVAELAATKNAVETLRNGVPRIETLGQVVPTGFDNKKQVSLSGRSMTRASKNALELEKKKLHIYEKLTIENEAIKASSDQGNRRTGQNFNRLIKTISATVENVRTKADELFNLIGSPEYPQSISILSFAEKVVFNCENSQKSDGFIFACSRVIVLVTSKIPLALDILLAELNRVCMYTVPKYVEYSPVLFQTREAYFKAIGYKEIYGKIENTDSYVERLSSIMRLYGALVQTEIGGFQNLHGLKEGWAWLARFLNSLPANLYTAVALQHFLEMSGYALYRRYRNQFEKLLRIIACDFLKALKEGNSDSVNAKLIKVKTSIINYVESSRFKKEPEGLQLRGHLDSNDFF
ncbi:LOW QUALITY PROTEIN: mRNA export factor GLE1-like [Primulina tabacum]|uniref:LOW QUALITY PROTEIN: mRNA export factor GLE1-like n=1 Tax=Primulina tabacum TaxID=48773 RepID=UPI003F590833